MVKLIVNNGERTFNINDLATLLKHRVDVVKRLEERFGNVQKVAIQSDTTTLLIKGE